MQTGDQGAFVVDTGEGKLADKVIAAIRSLTPKPIQFIANTSFRGEHTGGNARLGDAGQDPSLLGSFFVTAAPRGVTGFFSDPSAHATMMAHVNVQVRMQAAKAIAAAVPADTYLEDRRRKFHNGDAIELFYQKDAVTDGDSLIHFRRADVIVAGDIFTTTQYPVIDLKNGGSVQGEIRALNEILKKTVYRHQGEGGTYVVPGHGYLGDEHEVLEYRDMVVIVRDRVKAMIDAGATLAQVKAARVTADYDTQYGANTGPWTTEMFVDGGLRQPQGRPLTRARPPRITGGCDGSRCTTVLRRPRNQWCAGSYSCTLCHCSISTIGGIAIGSGSRRSGRISAHLTASRVVMVATRSVPTTSCGARLKVGTDTSTRRLKLDRRRNCSS